MERLGIVTGTSRGIGAAVARALAERGWGVVGLARGEAPGELAHQIHHQRLDLSDLTGVQAWFEGPFLERFPLGRAARVGLVNNAGALAPVGPATGLSAAELGASLAVNVAAPVWLAGFVLGHAAPHAAVRVVNLSSGAASRAYPGWSAYCAGKAALHMAGEVLAGEAQAYPELEGRDLAVVSYAPHVVETRMQETLRATSEALFPMRQHFVDLAQRGELVSPEGPAAEIADLLERDDLPLHSTTRYQPPA